LFIITCRVDFCDEVISEPLDVIIVSSQLIFTDIAVFFHLLEFIISVTADIADGHFGVFTFPSCILDEFFAAFFRQLWYSDVAYSSVACLTEAKVVMLNRSQYIIDRTFVLWCHYTPAWFSLRDPRAIVAWFRCAL